MERRHFLTLGGGALLAACAAPIERAPVPERTPGHLLFADTATGVQVLEAKTGRVIAGASGTDPLWSRLYDVRGTTLHTIDPLTGAQTGSTPVPAGPVTVRAASPNGGRVVLAYPDDPAAKRTTLIVADPKGATEPRTLTLDGAYAPDALSLDESVLFVINYVEDGYRVRRLDLASGRVGAVLTRDKALVPPGAEETMHGDSRVAVPSPGGDRLYTLYTHQPDHLHTRDLVAGRSTGVHAFVHVLSTVEQWTYCLDLPAPFGEGPAEGHSLAVTSKALYVFDSGSGSGVRSLTPDFVEVTKLTIPKAAGPAAAASTRVRGSAEEVVYVTAGGALYKVGSMDAVKVGPAPQNPRGLADGGDGTLWVGVDGAAVRLSARDGREVGRVPFPGLTLLRRAQPSS